MTETNSTLADSRFARKARQVIEEMGLQDAFIMQLTDAQKRTVDQFIDGEKRPDTRVAAHALFDIFIKMIQEDYVRVEFKADGASEVFVKDVDYD